MNIQTRETFNIDAKPAPGIVVESSQKSFRAYFPGVDGEGAEVLEFEHRPTMDPDELDVVVSRGYAELSASTIPEGGEFVLDGNRAVFAMVRAFRVVPFST